MTKPNAVIVGVGDGLSASLARALAPDYALTLAARTARGMTAVAEETGARCVEMDATDPGAMAALFEGLDGPPRVAVYNPSARVRGPLTELDAEEVRRAVEVTAYGAFLLGREAARGQRPGDLRRDAAHRRVERSGKRVDVRAKVIRLPQGKGAMLFTGASAGVKGFAQSSTFAMGKFAQRGLAESMSRELHPEGIHVAWINIDGAIRNPGVDPGAPDSKLDPDAIASEYLRLIAQHRSTWSNEIAIRPWVERF